MKVIQIREKGKKEGKKWKEKRKRKRKESCTIQNVECERKKESYDKGNTDPCIQKYNHTSKVSYLEKEKG